MKTLMAEQDATQILVDRAKAGERAAFDELIGKVQPRLQDTVQSWRRFQIGPLMDVQEILQETFIRAFRSLSNFEWTHDEAFFRWLCGIAKHALAQAAQDHRRVRLRGKQAAALFDEVANGGPTQSQAFRRNERFDRLERALEKLRPEHRQVLILSRIKGLTVKEIADRMDRSQRTVKYFLACALRELKKHFGDTESFNLPDRRLDTGGDRDDK
jgi:RNA polymerase sigma factor (sigma-70 family)